VDLEEPLLLQFDVVISPGCSDCPNETGVRFPECDHLLRLLLLALDILFEGHLILADEGIRTAGHERRISPEGGLQ
jgi:hypothetical protein